MKKALMAIWCVGLVAVSGLLLSPASADDFDVVWLIDLPRDTYFIGETVTFSVVAFASTDTTVMMPGEMGFVTIHNQTNVEKYSGWVTTGTNGTAVIDWDMGLEIEPGNFTIGLQPIGAEPVTKQFIILYDEATYWQTRVDQLEEELMRQYEYLNYLFATSNYLKREVHNLKNQVIVAGVVMVITIILTLTILLPELARRSRVSNGRFSMGASLARVMGLSSTPKVLLTDYHEELAQLGQIPHKRSPRVGLDYYCPMCDKDDKEPMTKAALAEHIAVRHSGKHILRRIKAPKRERVYNAVIKEDYKKIEEPEIPDGLSPIEIRRNELIDEMMMVEELRKDELKVKSKEDKKRERAERKAAEKSPKVKRKDRPKREKKPKKEKKAKRKKREKQESDDEPPAEPVLNDSPPAKPHSQRKVRRVKHMSGIPEDSDSKTDIDQLYDKLLKGD